MQLFSSPPQRSYAPTVIPQDVPVYKVGDKKFYVDDELLEAGEIISWSEEPNPHLIPMNKMAIERMRAYLSRLDELGREKAIADKKHYVPLLAKFEDSLRQEDEGTRRAGRLSNGQAEISVLGKKRGRPRIQKIVAQDAPETISLD